MKHTKLLAGCGVVAAVALLPTSLALAGTSPITVRVEGVKHELLAPTAVHEHSGSLTRFGAPSGKCSDDSAAGALDAATHHDWKGTWESSFGDYEITSILGETHTFSSKDYWEVFVNNVAAQTGVCELKLKPGEQILFAAVPQKGAMEPALRMFASPRSVRPGEHLFIHVRAAVKNRIVPIEGAEVSGGGLSGRTDSRGEVTLRPSRRGTLVLEATKANYVRGEVTVDVI